MHGITPLVHENMEVRVPILMWLGDCDIAQRPACFTQAFESELYFLVKAPNRFPETALVGQFCPTVSATLQPKARAALRFIPLLRADGERPHPRALGHSQLSFHKARPIIGAGLPTVVAPATTHLILDTVLRTPLTRVKTGPEAVHRGVERRPMEHVRRDLRADIFPVNRTLAAASDIVL